MSLTSVATSSIFTTIILQLSLVFEWTYTCIFAPAVLPVATHSNPVIITEVALIESLVNVNSTSAWLAKAAPKSVIIPLVESELTVVVALVPCVTVPVPVCIIPLSAVVITRLPVLTVTSTAAGESACISF